MSAQEVPPVKLSGRELAVVQGIALGKKYRMIANELGVGLETVRTYAARARAKLGLHCRSTVAVWAIRNQVAEV
jgi:DNA-binding NarL/FixJ family response regulator